MKEIAERRKTTREKQMQTHKTERQKEIQRHTRTDRKTERDGWRKLQ